MVGWHHQHNGINNLGFIILNVSCPVLYITVLSLGIGPGREAALAWASLAQRSPASGLLAREGAGCGSVGDVPGAWLASAPLWPSLWT